jgi:hypothetical protein
MRFGVSLAAFVKSIGIVVGHRGWLLWRAFGVVFNDSEAEKCFRRRLRFFQNAAEKASGQENHCWQRFGVGRIASLKSIRRPSGVHLEKIGLSAATFAFVNQRCLLFSTICRIE